MSGDKRNATGRVPGPRGMATRARLLGEVERRCLLVDYRTLSVAEIADAAHTSAGTFYHYFQDVATAVSEVVDQHLTGLDEVLLVVDEVVESGGELEPCRRFVRAFYSFWQERARLFEAIDADAGNPLLANIVRRALSTFTQRLGRGVHVHDPTAVAGSLMTMLNRSAITSDNFARDGVAIDVLIEAQAQILWCVLLAEQPAAPPPDEDARRPTA